jgi:hypothetical protein
MKYVFTRTWPLIFAGFAILGAVFFGNNGEKPATREDILLSTAVIVFSIGNCLGEEK